MSETSGGGWNEQNDNNSFDLDREWELWNQQMEEVPKNDDESLRRLLQYEEVKTEVMDRLDASGINRVVDKDTSKEADLFTDFAERWQRKALEEYDEAGTEPDDRQISIGCVTAYFEEREFEAQLINTATMLYFIAKHSEQPEISNPALVLLKKELQAGLLVHYQRSFDDEWYRFFDELIPVESLDLSLPDDDEYIVLAFESHGIYKKNLLIKQWVIDESLAIAGVNIDEDDLDDVIGMLADIMNMQLIANEPVTNEVQRANRNALLWEEGRKMHPDPKVVQQIIDLMDNTYPVVTPPEA